MKSEQSHIDISNPLKKGNKIWALCNIPGITKDRTILLSRDQMVIQNRKGSHKRIIEIPALRKLHVSHRKLLLPLVAGGVMAPFSALGLYEDLISYTLGLILFFIGILLMYLGFGGLPVLEIETVYQKELVFINQINKDVLSFVGFVNYLLPELQRDGNVHLYTMGDARWKQEEIDFSEMEEYLKKQSTVRLYTHAHIRNTFPPDQVLVKLDPSQFPSPMQVEFRDLQDPEVASLLAADIPLSAILGKTTVRELE